MSRPAASFVVSSRIQCLDWFRSFLRPFAPPRFHGASTLLWPLLTPAGLSSGRSPWVSEITFATRRRTLPVALRMTFGFRCCSPAHPHHRPHCPFVFLRSYLGLRPFRAVSSRSRPGLQLRLASPPPSGTFHPDSYLTCQAHEHTRPRVVQTGQAPVATGAHWSLQSVAQLQRAPVVGEGADHSTRGRVRSISQPNR